MDWRECYLEMLTGTMDVERISMEQAQRAIELTMDWIGEDQTDRSDQRLPEMYCRHMRTLLIRHATAFDAVRRRRSASSTERLAEQCGMEKHEVGLGRVIDLLMLMIPVLVLYRFQLIRVVSIISSSFRLFKTYLKNILQLLLLAYNPCLPKLYRS